VERPFSIAMRFAIETQMMELLSRSQCNTLFSSARIGLRRGIVGQLEICGMLRVHRPQRYLTIGQPQLNLPHCVPTPLSRTTIRKTKIHSNSDLVKLWTYITHTTFLSGCFLEGKDYNPETWRRRYAPQGGSRATNPFIIE
jgi:hypothetical protein